MGEDDVKKIYELSERITEQKVTIEKDIERVEYSLAALEGKLKDDIKQEIWDIKQNIKKVSQNEKDIAVLDVKIKSLEDLFDAYKDIVKNKEDRWYKNFSLWLSILALLSSIIFGYLNYSKTSTIISQQHGDNNVSSNHQK